MKKLTVISTKNPNTYLIRNVENLKRHYPDFQIVIIDSNSNDISILEKISKLYDDVIIEYAKNMNYEFGAWHYAFHKYNDYDIYMFIQDYLFILDRINDLENSVINNNVVYSWQYTAYLPNGHIQRFQDVYRGTKFDFLANIPNNVVITGGSCCTFIANKENTSKILEVEDIYIEKKIVKYKLDSWLSEPILGIMIDHLKFNRINLDPIVVKVPGNRQ